jgi:hypothetical protein
MKTQQLVVHQPIVVGPFPLSYTMKLFTVGVALGFATPAFLQVTYPLWYDTTYDQT